MDALKRGISDSNNHIPKMATCFTRKYRFGIFILTPMPRFRAWLNYKHVFRGCTSTTSTATSSPLQTFSNSEFGDVRVIMQDDEPWFVGKDVADSLDYQNGSRDINRHVAPEDRTKEMVFDGNQRKETILINESGLYSVILSSKLPSAKKFKHWVTSEVLPSIRKHGINVGENYEKTACIMTTLYI